MPPEHHPCEAGREGFDDVGTLEEGPHLRRVELREDRFEPEVAAHILAQGNVLEVREAGEALVAERLEVIGVPTLKRGVALRRSEVMIEAWSLPGAPHPARGGPTGAAGRRR